MPLALNGAFPANQDPESEEEPTKRTKRSVYGSNLTVAEVAPPQPALAKTSHSRSVATRPCRHRVIRLCL